MASTERDERHFLDWKSRKLSMKVKRKRMQEKDSIVLVRRLLKISTLWMFGIIPSCGNIRIFNGCKVRIANSVTKVTVRHQNSYPEWRNFQFALNNHYGYSSLSLHMCFLGHFYAKISTFSVKECSARFLPTTLTSKRFSENDVKQTSGH